MSGLSTDGVHTPVWVDGQLVAWDKAQLHAASFGLNNASCVFEGIRVYNGDIFALEEHAARLLSSAHAIGLEISYTRELIINAVVETVHASAKTNAYVRPLVWSGSEILGIIPDETPAHMAILVVPWKNIYEGKSSGIRLTWSRWMRPAATMAPVTAKASCNYVIASLARREANARGYDDALLLDHRGYVAEATGANVFIVLEDRLVTPIADACLPGITRRIVMDLAHEQGIEVTQKRLRPADIVQASEIFLTGTASELQPVCSVGDQQLPQEHPVTSALTEAYRQATGHNRT
ncbi:branched-chain-amino-acid transaminase [Streptomyces collinus]|uniref:branched-chain-amino-acid transaminase n=1 Tax=Streptomyces collinus TaxID=42684 RepID=UPI00369EB2FD